MIWIIILIAAFIISGTSAGVAIAIQYQKLWLLGILVPLGAMAYVFQVFIAKRLEQKKEARKLDGLLLLPHRVLSFLLRYQIPCKKL